MGKGDGWTYGGRREVEVVGKRCGVSGDMSRRGSRSSFDGGRMAFWYLDVLWTWNCRAGKDF